MDTRAERYAKAAITAELNQLGGLANGRNGGLNRAAYQFGQLVAAGALPEEEATKLLVEACERNGYLRKDGIASVRATIKSGLRKGMEQPRELPRAEDLRRTNGHQASSARRQTLVEFAAQRRFDVAALEHLGWKQTLRGIEIEHRAPDGAPARTQIREPTGSSHRFMWDGDKTRPIVAYAPEPTLAAEQGFALMCEGASDVAAALVAGLPAIGIPGSSMARKTLHAQHVAGLSHLFVCVEPGAGGDTFWREVPAQLQRLRFTGEVHALRMPEGAKDLCELYTRDPDTFAAKVRAAMDAATQADAAPTVGALDALWAPVGAWDALTASPTPREWLLKRPDDQTNGATTVGVLPLGKACLLYGDGGAGKTFALVGLALAVATGRKYLDYFEVPNPGRVLLVLGEEDRDELHRRLFAVARAMRLTDEQIRLAGERIVALPMAGTSVALLEDVSGLSTESGFSRELRARLEAEGDMRLIILDPLSRFADAEAEKDNHAATRFVQHLESFLRVPGRPTLLMSHHNRKPARAEPAGANMANARGASALTAAFRWAGELERTGESTARFTVTKSNYSPLGVPLELVRDAASEGALRVATSEERRQLFDAKAETTSAAQRERVEVDARALLELMRTRPSLSARSMRDEARAALGWGTERVGAARARLESGVDGYRAVNRGTERESKWVVVSESGAV